MSLSSLLHRESPLLSADENAALVESDVRVSLANQHATADYVQEMSRQLATLSSYAGLEFLAYLLDMVRVEAELVKGRTAALPDMPPP